MYPLVVENECKSHSNSNSSELIDTNNYNDHIYEPTVIRKRSKKRSSSRFKRVAHSTTAHSSKHAHRLKPKRKSSRTHSVPPLTSPSVLSTLCLSHNTKPCKRSKAKRSKKSISLPPKRSHRSFQNAKNSTNAETPIASNARSSFRRRIEPKIIERSLDCASVQFCLSVIREWRAQHPKRRRVSPQLVGEQQQTTSAAQSESDSNRNERATKRRKVTPELIGKVSRESIAAKQTLSTYFNAQHNAMYNEQDFEKYTSDSYDSQCYGYASINEENTMPMIKEEEKENESDISICSNPDDVLSISSYRRKMVKTYCNENGSKKRGAAKKAASACKASKTSKKMMSRKQNANEKKAQSVTPTKITKITDYFPTVSSLKLLN